MKTSSNYPVIADDDENDTILSQEDVLLMASVYARRQYEEKTCNSNIPNKSQELPMFAFQELRKGRLLGTGNFGHVFEIKSFRPSTSNTETQQQELGRRRIRDDCQQGQEKKNPRYCMKVPRYNSNNHSTKEFMNETVDPYQLSLGLIDIAMETHFLSSLQHPNIIQLHAIAKGDVFDTTDTNNKYFIVLDHLQETLEHRLKHWEKMYHKYHGIMGGIFGRDPHGIHTLTLYKDRLSAIVDLSSALAYLHKSRVIHRDFKIANIGFDCHNTIKIFDFGLAKELPDAATTTSEFYNFTSMVGTPRYMAPEVANRLPYNESCDVYSFSIILWQILSLLTPYHNYKDLQSMQDNVWNGPNDRPAINQDTHSLWSTSLKQLVQQSWSNDPKRRLSMIEMESQLKEEYNQCEQILDLNVIMTQSLVYQQQQLLEQEQQKSRIHIPPLSSCTALKKNENVYVDIHSVNPCLDVLSCGIHCG